MCTIFASPTAMTATLLLIKPPVISSRWPMINRLPHPNLSMASIVLLYNIILDLSQIRLKSKFSNDESNPTSVVDYFLGFIGL